MNNIRRNEINIILEDIREKCKKLGDHLADEGEEFENLPEEIQLGENGQSIEKTLDALTIQLDTIEIAVSEMSEIILQ